MNFHVCCVSAATVKGYTQHEVECAAHAASARKLYQDLSTENVRNIKVWLRSDQSKNVNILVEDVKLAEKIYKTDVETCNEKI